ncbi:hypothetical protein AUP68_08463 [Ilyonectria robusta]
MVTASSPGLCPNKYLDSDGDLIFPVVDELCGMTDSDQEEWQRACETSRPHRRPYDHDPRPRDPQGPSPCAAATDCRLRQQPSSSYIRDGL